MSQEFTPWFKENLGNRMGWVPKDLDAWVKEVDESHEEIRKLLGGVRKTFKLPATEGLVPADFNSVYYMKRTIDRIIPSYFTKYELTQDVLSFPNIRKLRNISTAKHILGYADRQKVSPESRKTLEDELAKLGLAWAKAKIKSPETNVTITTTPQAFALLGLLPCDKSSCFKHGAGNSDKRYAVGIMKDSFVIMYHTDEEVEEKVENDKISGRSIGVLSKHEDEFILNNTNNYPQLGGLTATSKAVGTPTQLEKLASAFLGFEEPLTLRGHCNFKNEITYNYWTGSSIYDKKKIKQEVPRQMIEGSKKYYEERRTVTYGY